MDLDALIDGPEAERGVSKELYTRLLGKSIDPFKDHYFCYGPRDKTPIHQGRILQVTKKTHESILINMKIRYLNTNGSEASFVLTHKRSDVKYKWKKKSENGLAEICKLKINPSPLILTEPIYVAKEHTDEQILEVSIETKSELETEVYASTEESAIYAINELPVKIPVSPVVKKPIYLR